MKQSEIVISFIETFLTLGHSFAGKPFILMDWQKDIIRDIYCTDSNGKRLRRTYVLGLPRKNGKALALDTPLLTADGWKTMGTVKPGDHVHAPDGSLTLVTGKSETFCDSTYEIDFSDGSTFCAHGNHEWVVKDRWRGRVLTRTTAEMAQDFLLSTREYANGYTAPERRYSVAVPAAIERSDTDLPLDPYVFGLWLGDGHSASARLTGELDDLAFYRSELESIGYFMGDVAVKPDSNCGEATISCAPIRSRAGSMQAKLRELGVLGDKHIPQEYLLGSIDQRLALLQGLMDTDGTISKSGQAVFTATNENLADGVLFLVRSLGMKATKKKGVARLYGIDIGPKYDVLFYGWQDMPPVRLPRKVERLRERPAKATRNSTIQVVDIREVLPVETVCIEVSHKSHQFLAGESLTPTHNSEFAACLALYHLIVDTADSRPEVISAAGDRKQARLVFEEAVRMVKASPELSEICTVLRNEIRCERTGGRYYAVSADAGLQQGLNPSFVVFDELHIFKNDELYVALTQGSPTRNQPLTLVISTAGWDLNGPLGRLYSTGLKTNGHRLNGTPRAGEVEDPSFGMTWYGPEPGQKVDSSDEAAWELFNPLWPVLNADDFRSAYRTTHESQFIRYRMNGWTSAENAWLPHGAWEALTDETRTLADNEPVILGFDGAWVNDSTALVAVSVNDLHIEVIDLWENPGDDIDWRTPVGEVEDAIRAACERFNVREITADPYYFSQTLMMLRDEGWPVVEYRTNEISRIIPATKAFYDAVRDGLVSHNGDPRLARHMANCVLKETRNGSYVTKESKGSKRKIDLAMATIVAFDRARHWRDVVETPRRDPQLILL